MTDPVNDAHSDPYAETRHDTADNASFNAARRHVGAAGFVQRDVLEQIISAGREQIGVTQSLRQVIASTQTQLSALTDGQDTEETRAHIKALRGVVAASQAQIEAATTLRRAIQGTLAEVRGTPLEEISGTLLQTLGEVVRRQQEQLQALITVALGEADSAGQKAQLRRLSAEASERHLQAEHEQAERDLAQLELAGAEALERIRELEKGGVSHAAQRAALELRAEENRERIATLEQQALELTSLQEDAAATEPRRTLEERAASRE